MLFVSSVPVVIREGAGCSPTVKKKQLQPAAAVAALYKYIHTHNSCFFYLFFGGFFVSGGRTKTSPSAMLLHWTCAEAFAGVAASLSSP